MDQTMKGKYFGKINVKVCVKLGRSVPADGDVIEHAGRIILLHPGHGVEESRQEQINAGHDDRNGQQTRLLQQQAVRRARIRVGTRTNFDVFLQIQTHEGFTDMNAALKAR